LQLVERDRSTGFYQALSPDLDSGLERLECVLISAGHYQSRRHPVQSQRKAMRPEVTVIVQIGKKVQIPLARRQILERDGCAVQRLPDVCAGGRLELKNPIEPLNYPPFAEHDLGSMSGVDGAPGHREAL
jgi:hypothetical protein